MKDRVSEQSAVFTVKGNLALYQGLSAFRWRPNEPLSQTLNRQIPRLNFAIGRNTAPEKPIDSELWQAGTQQVRFALTPASAGFVDKVSDQIREDVPAALRYVIAWSNQLPYLKEKNSEDALTFVRRVVGEEVVPLVPVFQSALLCASIDTLKRYLGTWHKEGKIILRCELHPTTQAMVIPVDGKLKRCHTIQIGEVA